ncbi:hypothetical protein OG210_12245 [Streptomyces sp. NBC_00466]|uniref:hypothetical protein n=1 Tax=Streptomyces sp. NBC_00466 TaxID=2903655 RepID=UPI0030E415B7
MSAVPLPDISWCDVRFGAPRVAGAEARPGLPGDRIVVPVAVGWRSAAGYGSASVLLFTAAGISGSRPRLFGTRLTDTHLRMNPDAPRQAGRAEYADVLVTRTPLPSALARRRADMLMARYPGCLVAAVPDAGNTLVLGVRGSGGGVLSAWPAGAAPGRRVAPHVIASVLHAWLVAGGTPAALRSVRPAAPVGSR